MQRLDEPMRAGIEPEAASSPHLRNDLTPAWAAVHFITILTSKLLIAASAGQQSQQNQPGRQDARKNGENSSITISYVERKNRYQSHQSYVTE